MTPLVSMRRALSDPLLLGRIMGAPSRLAWRAVLIAAMGETLEPDELDIFRQLSERSSTPLMPISAALRDNRKTGWQELRHRHPGRI